MLIHLTKAQLEAIGPIAADGTITVDCAALATLLGEKLEIKPPRIAITKVDYDEHGDGTPEPATRSVRGIAWLPIEQHNHSRVWSFRSDGLALSTAEEGVQLSPISEDSDLITRAIIAVADGYPGSHISDRTARIELGLVNGKTKQVRVVVAHDARITRPEDVLAPLEFLAYGAGALGVAIVQPVEGGQALIRKMGL